MKASFSPLVVCFTFLLLYGGSVFSEPTDIEASLADADTKAEKIVAASLQPPVSGVTSKAMAVFGKTSQLSGEISALASKTSDIGTKNSGVDKKVSSIDETLNKLGAKVSATEVVIRLPGSILFAFDKSELRPDAIDTLNEVLRIVDSYKGKPVRVEGHTCSMGTDEYNQKLSERRAQSVADWLKSKKVSASRLKTKGFGEVNPISDNNSEIGRAQNRRVEIIISKVGR